ncbi:MAG: hypothetical protein PHW24_02765 [Candidatus Moranbacteria bacterium]|nr:hypothetical protein [Candidatus Moranbacteria bacterium]
MHIINIAHAGVISDAPSVSHIGINVLFFLLSVAGIVAIISLVLAGVKYFLAIGDEKVMESAKRSATYASWGILLAMGSMILIRFMGQFFAQ